MPGQNHYALISGLITCVLLQKPGYWTKLNFFLYSCSKRRTKHYCALDRACKDESNYVKFAKSSILDIALLCNLDLIYLEGVEKSRQQEGKSPYRKWRHRNVIPCYRRGRLFSISMSSDATEHQHLMQITRFHRYLSVSRGKWRFSLM